MSGKGVELIAPEDAGNGPTCEMLTVAGIDASERYRDIVAYQSEDLCEPPEPLEGLRTGFGQALDTMLSHFNLTREDFR